VPWITVLGRGSWMFDGQRFHAGQYEVSEEVAEAARQRRNIVVTDEKPPLVEEVQEEALSKKTTRRPYRSTGVQIQEPPPSIPDETEMEQAVPLDFRCDCGYRAPSPPALNRHKQFEHPGSSV